MSYDYILSYTDFFKSPVRDNQGVLLNSVKDKPYVGTSPHGKIKAWYKDGVFHRENDKPARVSTIAQGWFVYGSAHRVNGPQIITKRTETEKPFALFGIALSREEHSAIINHWLQYRCPLWVSFFCFFKIIDNETFNSFLDENHSWNCELPFDWIMKTFSIDKEKILDAFWEDIPKSVLPGFLNQLDKISQLPTY